MKRIAAGFAVVILSIAGFYLLIFGLVSSEKARFRMISTIEAWTGRKVAISERADIGLFPSPRLTLYGLRISGAETDPSDAFLTAETLSADVRILPLFIGQLGFKSLELTKPTINIVRDAKGQRNWRFDGSSAAIQLALSGELPVERLAMNGATIHYRDIARDEQETVDIPEFSIDWRSLRQPAGIRGSISRNDDAFSFDVGITDPLAFFERKSSAVTVTLGGDLFAAQFEGELADYKSAQFSGTMNATGVSLRRLISLAGGQVPKGPGLGPFAVRGYANINLHELFVDQGEIELDGNIASGSMHLTLSEGAKLSGTLAFQSLDLTSYLALLGGSGPEHWPERQMDTNWFDNFDADLRLSADKIVVGAYELGSTAASAFLKDKQLEIGLAQSVFYDGTISGNISVTDLPKKTGQKLAVQLRAADFDLGSAANMAGAASDISGTATMTVDLATAGANLGEQLEGVSGSISLRSADGKIPDLGLALAWQALSGNSGLNSTVGRSASDYQQLEFDGTLNQQRIIVDNIALVSDAYSADLNGIYQIAERTVTLQGNLAARQTSNAGSRLSIKGPISRPTLTMEPHGN